MSCRRAFELDPVEFLADPRSREFGDFVDHYPRCPECSAEVRAWTELQVGLADAGQAHPEPATLLQLQRHPESLGETRARVAAHVAHCRTCSEELEALRRFESQPRPVAVSSRRRGSLRAALSRLRGLVLHPAFAYALVLLLLVPALRDRGFVPVGEPKLAPPEAPAAQPSEVRGNAAARRPPQRERSLAPPRAVRPPSPSGTLGRVEADTRAAAPRPEAEPHMAEGAPLRGLAGAAARPAKARSLAPRFDPASGSLEVRLPAALDPGTPLWVRVTSEDGQRELRERRTLAAQESALRVELPRAWQRPGSYRVELRIGEGEDARVLAGRVRIP
ncbi:MAG: hypothetical protein ACE5IL_05170 [Myxococcota bacterium]